MKIQSRKSPFRSLQDKRDREAAERICDLALKASETIASFDETAADYNANFPGDVLVDGHRQVSAEETVTYTGHLKLDSRTREVESLQASLICETRSQPERANLRLDGPRPRRHDVLKDVRAQDLEQRVVSSETTVEIQRHAEGVQMVVNGASAWLSHDGLLSLGGMPAPVSDRPWAPTSTVLRCSTFDD